ncbi:excinuclease ABC subunit A [bacterium Unc6]|nr:excinuclease ABC subunit A [bacterium Unc6]
MTDMQNGDIVIIGAKQHNLKDISVKIPKNKFVVITGVSGSGKSSLAFDTIYAEGQRRYAQSLSTYARQFIEQIERPNVDYISGLSPSIAIEQRTSFGGIRSTVGTQSGIYDYVRLLFARIGTPYCPECKKPITFQTHQHILEKILEDFKSEPVYVLSPVIRGRKGEHVALLEQLRMQGFAKVFVDSSIKDLTPIPKIDKKKLHNISVVVDQLTVNPAYTYIVQRLSSSIQTAIRLSEGLVNIASISDIKNQTAFSQLNACPGCGFSFPEIEPRTFSFNSSYGACRACQGTGLTIEEEVNNEQIKEYKFCPDCKGARLKSSALNIYVGGKNIKEICEVSVEELLKTLSHIQLDKRERLIGFQIIKEIQKRLSFLKDVGLGYLTLGRNGTTLAGGEAQRIRIASQIGSQLIGVLYILDEPSIGLHHRDNKMLLTALSNLRDMGNTVIVVEHDEDTMRKADFIVDLGFGAGIYGGNVVATGTAEQIKMVKDSLTGQYLSGAKKIPMPEKRRSFDKTITLSGATHNNLKNITANFPLSVFCCITGVSGSGKSSLVMETLYPAVCHKLGLKRGTAGRYKEIKGFQDIDRVQIIDQKPIGKTPRSNPATYTGLFTGVRNLFSQLPDSRAGGFKSGRFSFNVKGGRCEECTGKGVKRIGMQFLPDVYVTCDTCRGTRYNEQTLCVRFKGLSISDVLNLTVDEAINVFSAIPSIRFKLSILKNVGLGYIHLGQGAATLSGGEAQRLKISAELSRKQTGRTLIIMDEPTVGLHSYDIQSLLDIINRLVLMGNTVIVIEHNLDVIKAADYIIDLGPESANKGGSIVVEGTPEDVVLCKNSYTAKVLKIRDVLK